MRGEIAPCKASPRNGQVRTSFSWLGKLDGCLVLSCAVTNKKEQLLGSRGAPGESNAQANGKSLSFIPGMGTATVLACYSLFLHILKLQIYFCVLFAATRNEYRSRRN